MNQLLDNIDKIKTTELGVLRIKKNLTLNSTTDAVVWCKQKIKEADEIVRKGKNYYIHVEGAVITVNAHSFTIITAHNRR